MLVIERKLFSYQLVINMEINFLGQFWTIKDEILVNKAELWVSRRTVDWNFSRDYSWADIPGFEKIYIVSCRKQQPTATGIRRRRRRSAETKKYTYGKLVNSNEFIRSLHQFLSAMSLRRTSKDLNSELQIYGYIKPASPSSSWQG